LPGLQQALLKEELRKKKRAVDVDVFTRFSFLNKFIIAQKKRKVKGILLIQRKRRMVWKEVLFSAIL
jgi:hypothetical protein